jgi:uncharacterized protein (DUF305 family)
MEKNKSIVLAVGMLIVGLVIGGAFGSKGDRDGRYGFDKSGRGDKVEKYAKYGAPNQMSSHMMPNGEMMSNGMGSMSMADMMTSMNAELQGKSGDAFDQAFLSEMIVHHQGAVEMAKLALTNAKHQEIKDLAKAIIAAQNKEIGDMQSWAKAWYQK